MCQRYRILCNWAKNADLLIFTCAVLDPPGSPSQLYDLHTPPKKIGEAARRLKQFVAIRGS